MQLGLSADQELLRSTTRKFLEAESPLTDVRALADDPAGFTRDYWRRAAQLGWTTMLVAEADGGGSLSGEGLLDLVIVAEEMGRLVAPGPVRSHQRGGLGAESFGFCGRTCSEFLPGLVDGSLVAAWVASDGMPSRAIGGCRADRSADGFVLNGVAAPVEAGAQADVVLVTAATEAGPTQFLVDTRARGVTAVPMGSIDLVRRFAELRFDDVAIAAPRMVGEIGDAAVELEQQLRIALVLQCAETVGATQQVLDFTLAYVADRYSFGRPLASYQALKHRFADMKMWLEASHGTTAAAARAVQDEAVEAGELVSAAKAYVTVNATEIVQDCVQMHGGIGITWEHDLHLYLRRATLNRGLYGSPADHLERIAGLLGMGEPSAIGSADR